MLISLDGWTAVLYAVMVHSLAASKIPSTVIEAPDVPRYGEGSA
jgi:hypothetical protein